MDLESRLKKLITEDTFNDVVFTTSELKPRDIYHGHRCPSCNARNWAYKDDLYLLKDWEKKSKTDIFRCYSCGVLFSDGEIENWRISEKG